MLYFNEIRNIHFSSIRLAVAFSRIQKEFKSEKRCRVHSIGLIVL